MLWYAMGQDKDKLAMLETMCARVSQTPEYGLFESGGRVLVYQGQCAYIFVYIFFFNRGRLPVEASYCL